ncbi:UDP-glucose 4-epimerase family protein [Thiothrix lacustris]|uniref:UDP-glucose 4-epimerase family protein n=1 Tax=Thiothrix lacustris TaxID=525917 RepID=UPI0027E4A6B2|nr:SDR family oxidoreductase [Thiothrix lacustris]WMP17961.1 SDR family oxidoreductase [Thiothrix lacustris]
MILLTGSTGFIGQSLSQKLTNQKVPLTAAVRRTTDTLPDPIRQVPVGDLLPNTDWSQALTSVDAVIHLAARVHVMQDTATDPLAAFRNINTAGTLNLARQAAAAGVRRFIFLSSIKVNGEHTTADKPFTADDTHIPTDLYGISKYEAEQGLHELALQTGMEVVIIRPPLVYGPGVKANFLSMMRWLHKGIPLPLGAIHNQRSLVALNNLVDLITTCIDHPAAANQTFLVSDGEDLSTTALLQRLGSALGKPTRLLPVPQRLLTASLTLLGKAAIAQRLCGNLQVDISKTRDLLGWVPPLSVDEALRQTAQAYLQSRR